jgi:hypothetical protein
LSPGMYGTQNAEKLKSTKKGKKSLKMNKNLNLL